MEKEICRREKTYEPNKIFKYLMYVFFGLAIISLLAYLHIIASNHYWEQMFDFDDDIDLTFYSKDAKYYDMLTMFKEIKKRGYR